MASLTSSSTPINLLPPEIHNLIFTYLDAVTYTCLGLTCKHFYAIYKSLYPDPTPLSTYCLLPPDRHCGFYLFELLATWMPVSMVFDYDLVRFIMEEPEPPCSKSILDLKETDYNRWQSLYRKLNFWKAKAIKKRKEEDRKILAARGHCLMKWQYEAEEEAGGYYQDGVFGEWTLALELAVIREEVGPRCSPRYRKTLLGNFTRLFL